jgi:hypothetical protein
MDLIFRCLCDSIEIIIINVKKKLISLNTVLRAIKIYVKNCKHQICYYSK